MVCPFCRSDVETTNEPAKHCDGVICSNRVGIEVAPGRHTYSCACQCGGCHASHLDSSTQVTVDVVVPQDTPRRTIIEDDGVRKLIAEAVKAGVQAGIESALQKEVK